MSLTSAFQTIRNVGIMNPVAHKTKPMDGIFLEAFLVKCTGRFALFIDIDVLYSELSDLIH